MQLSLMQRKEMLGFGTVMLEGYGLEGGLVVLRD